MKRQSNKEVRGKKRKKEEFFSVIFVSFVEDVRGRTRGRPIRFASGINAFRWRLSGKRRNSIADCSFENLSISIAECYLFFRKADRTRSG